MLSISFTSLHTGSIPILSSFLFFLLLFSFSPIFLLIFLLFLALSSHLSPPYQPTTIAAAENHHKSVTFTIISPPPLDDILISEKLGGGTDLTTSFVDIGHFEAVKREIVKGKTKVLYFETMSNPVLTVANVQELCRIAHDKGVMVVVDNTFASMVVSPARLGADVVVHSISKFICGGADIIAGVALTEKWAEKCKDKGIGFYSMHPGWAETPGVSKSSPSFSNSYRENLEQVNKEPIQLYGWLYSLIISILKKKADNLIILFSEM
ncbi:hypothetical protein CASFOL_024580 [Castilleja foliolosa]|uniref:Cystathionine gamma-lyase n=1 Tax=Castilleja foliolosa TaxID=1961234 RepID=A0ABD3CNQ9_9LAMI